HVELRGQRRIKQVGQIADDVPENQAAAGVGNDAELNRAGIDIDAEQIQMHRRDSELDNLRGRNGGVAQRAAAHAADGQVGGVEQVNRRTQHAVESGAGLLEVDQRRGGVEQIA